MTVVCQENPYRHAPRNARASAVESVSVSVVIPSYNAERWIAQAVASVLAQTRRARQIIVVDDGSTDNTFAALKPYLEQGVEYVRQDNRGVAAARNAGVLRATEEFVAFLDADDVWHPRKLEVQTQLMAGRPDLAILGSETFDWPGDVPVLLDSVEDATPNEIPWNQLIIRNRFTTSSMIARRSALPAAGELPFDTDLQGPEDYDLWLRISERATVAKLDLALTGYRQVEGSLSKQARTMEMGISRVLAKAARRGAWDRRGGGILRRKSYASFYYAAAYMYGAAGRQAIGISRVLRSMLAYPLPLGPSVVRSRFGRPKMLAVLILRLLRLKAPENALHR